MSKRIKSIEKHLGLYWEQVFKTHSYNTPTIPAELSAIKRKINMLAKESGKEFTSELRLAKRKIKYGKDE